jgi:hypothetical protein
MRMMHLLRFAVFVATVISGQEKAVAQRPHFGGHGGTEHGSKQCPDHVIGIHGYVGTGGEGGTVVTQLGFTCANGEHELGTFGPPQGTYFQIDCNPGDAANGVTAAPAITSMPLASGAATRRGIRTPHELPWARSSA